MSAPIAQSRRLPFGRLLRELRLAAGLSQEALAELARMSSGGISVLERGARRAPLRETVTLLADALSLSEEARAQFESAARSANSSRRRGQPATESAKVRGNVPFALTSFVGRDRLKAAVCERVLEGRLVTLTGVGGVGKTRLAIEAAHELADRFKDGVWFIELSPVSHAALVPNLITATMNVISREGDAWITELTNMHALIVLDNCEHLLEACASIAKSVLERCPAMHMLATSREALRIGGERVVRVDPLRESSAIEMFLARVHDVAPEFHLEPGGESWEAVREIARALDGIPLALELAAARVPSTALKTIAKNLDQRLALLRRGDRAAVARQQTMRALIDWSYDLLSPAEQRIFEELSVFAGGCTVEDATAICGDGSMSELEIVDLLTSLVEKSLTVVDMDVDDPRYTLLDVFREYAGEKLTARGMQSVVEARHAQAYLTFAQRASQEWDAITPTRAQYVRTEAELSNWRAAIDWALERKNDVLLGQRMVDALRRVWLLFAPAEGRRLCALALDRAGDETPATVIANLEYTQALIAFHQFDHPFAQQAAQRALDRFTAAGERLGTAYPMRIIGITRALAGDVSTGEPLLFDALAIAREFHVDRLTGIIEGSIGMSRTIANDIPGAVEHFSRAREIFLAMGDEREALTHSINLAEALRKSGDIEKALELSQETLASARALDHVFAVTNTLAAMSAYCVALNRFDEARSLALEAIETSRKPRFGVFILWTLQHFAAAIALKPYDSGEAADAHYARAARIVGYIDARLPASQDTRDFTEKVEYERTLAALSAALGAAGLKALLRDGAAMNEDQAIEQAVAG